ncbi:MAG TPA: Hsp20/alpha crystallin family protein [Syntrophomonadaceae bacterium]|nr:Hsp20/alpha crystallin family protein [Syntrophomonadaceae bacterium]HPU49735.1 Hsp20/alpha crystallin family protein [Syntrophomonadaceae bacterium]
MSGLVPFNRWGLSRSGFEDFYNLIDDFFSNTWMPMRSMMRDTFRLDIQENEREYCIEAELPGVKKEEINLELKDDGRLTISVEREESLEEEKKNYVHRERRYSSMQRSIYLRDAKTEGVKAQLKDGILRIIVPKEEAQGGTHRIQIS